MATICHKHFWETRRKFQNQRSEHTGTTPPVPRPSLRRGKPGEQARNQDKDEQDIHRQSFPTDCICLWFKPVVPWMVLVRCHHPENVQCAWHISNTATPRGCLKPQYLFIIPSLLPLSEIQIPPDEGLRPSSFQSPPSRNRHPHQRWSCQTLSRIQIAGKKTCLQ